MEITKCVGGRLDKGHTSTLTEKLSAFFRSNTTTLSYVITDNVDYLVDLVLGNT